MALWVNNAQRSSQVNGVLERFKEGFVVSQVLQCHCMGRKAETKKSIQALASLLERRAKAHLVGIVELAVSGCFD